MQKVRLQVSHEKHRGQRLDAELVELNRALDNFRRMVERHSVNGCPSSALRAWTIVFSVIRTPTVTLSFSEHSPLRVDRTVPFSFHLFSEYLQNLQHNWNPFNIKKRKNFQKKPLIVIISPV